MESVIVAMVTPFTEDLEVDYDAAVKLGKKLSEQGCGRYISVWHNW